MTVLTEGQLDTRERGFASKRSRGQRIRRCMRRDLKRFFLHAFARHGNVSKSCRELLVARNTVYQWMKKDRVFARRYQAIQKRLYPKWEEPEIASQEEYDARVRMMSDRDLMRAMKVLSRKNRFW